TFLIEYGTADKIIHRPNMVERGQPVGYYTCVFLAGDAVDFEFMTLAEMEEHRDRFVQKDKQGNIPAQSPRLTNFEPLAWKTTARRVLKRVPVSIELQKAVTWDEYEEQGLLQHRPETGLSRTDLVGARIGVGEVEEEGAGEQPGKASAKVL